VRLLAVPNGENETMRVCRVVAIDPYAPYRRQLGGDCWPAALGQANLGRAIWQPPGEARRLLAEIGVPVLGSESWEIPTLLESLNYELRQRPVVEYGSGVSLQIFHDPQVWGDRVVGFQLREGSLAQERPTANLREPVATAPEHAPAESIPAAAPGADSPPLPATSDAPRPTTRPRPRR
jgi:hypothetical protein